MIRDCEKGKPSPPAHCSSASGKEVRWNCSRTDLLRCTRCRGSENVWGIPCSLDVFLSSVRERRAAAVRRGPSKKLMHSQCVHSENCRDWKSQISRGEQTAKKLKLSDRGLEGGRAHACVHGSTYTLMHACLYFCTFSLFWRYCESVFGYVTTKSYTMNYNVSLYVM